MNIKFGIVPDKMKLRKFIEVMSLDNSWPQDLCAWPLIPLIQSFWSGRQVSDWLVSAGVVDMTRGDLIADKLDGSLLQRRVLDILTNEDIDSLQLILLTKAYITANLVWKL
jgi:hypothetical protein